MLLKDYWYTLCPKATVQPKSQWGIKKPMFRTILLALNRYAIGERADGLSVIFLTSPDIQCKNVTVLAYIPLCYR